MADIELIKQLRDSTGYSFSEIRKALDSVGGDKGKALQILQSLGATIAEKKAVRSTSEGIVESYVHATKKIGALVELLCETDFVARNSLFTELAHELAMHIAAMDPQSGDELLAQPFIKEPTVSIQQLIQTCMAKIGENIKVGRFVRFQI